jgi:hypothetical protein
MKNTQTVYMDDFLTWVLDAVTNVKLLAVIGGFVGLSSANFNLIADINAGPMPFLRGLLYACIYAAAGWFIKYLLDGLKKKRFNIFKKKH